MVEVIASSVTWGEVDSPPHVSRTTPHRGAWHLPPPEESVMTCPHCGSRDYEHVHIHNRGDLAHATHLIHPFGLAVAAAAWLAKKAGDALSDKYKCKTCGNRFS